jgi:tetratricopeptide (TPR) repeat protein
MLKAGRLFPHPEILEATAALAFKYDRYEDAADALERLIAIEPGNVLARRNASLVYTRQKNHTRAAQHFAKLRELEPNDPFHGVNHASAVALSGDAEESLRIYDVVCKSATAPIEAFIGRAQVLKALERPKEAFAGLMSQKERFWDRPEFVQAVLDVSFASDEEEIGHKALIRLRELQHEGKADQSILQEKTLDDVIAHLKEHNQRAEQVRHALLVGQIPWLAADEAAGHTSVGGWVIRTQTVSWLFDDPLHRAALCAYSTNSFTARPASSGGRWTTSRRRHAARPW